MKKFRKLIKLAAICALFIVPAVALSGCGKQTAIKKNDIKVGVVGSQDNKIWKPIQNKLRHRGIHLKVVDFSDYTQPNQALQHHNIQLNAFQHYLFLHNWNSKNHGDLTPVARTVVAPLGLYSYKIHKPSQLKDGDTVTLPNDATNEGRALNLLKSAGLIKLKKAALPTTKDVIDNKKHLKLKPIDAAQTPRTLKDAKAAVINNTFAEEAKLSNNSLIFNEKLNKKIVPYINILVSNKKDKNNKYIKDIIKAYQTKSTAKNIKKNFGDAEKPAWNLKF